MREIIISFGEPVEFDVSNYNKIVDKIKETVVELLLYSYAITSMSAYDGDTELFNYETLDDFITCMKYSIPYRKYKSKLSCIVIKVVKFL